MNKAKITLCITIICICTILVSVGFMRFKVVDNNDRESEEVLIETELRQEIASLKDKYNHVIEETETINAKIDEYKEQIDKNEDSSELIKSEIRQTSQLLGKTKVKGDGVVIIMQDNESEKIIESDLSEIINELKYAGAEAISINNIRIDSLSDVTTTTNNIMMIEGKRISSPYEIKAIRKPNVFI